MQLFDPRLDVLPAAQREIWDSLRPAARSGFVLYGGTAIALQLGHRTSVDFDFFSAGPLDKEKVGGLVVPEFDARVLQESPNTLVVLAPTRSGEVKLSFFGRLAIGRVADPRQTRDGVLVVASLDDLMATKLKAILDRAEAKDYRDIAAMLTAGVSLAKGLSTFRQMFGGEPATVLKALGYFGDGDLQTLAPEEMDVLRTARDRVGDLPTVELSPGSLAPD